MSEERTCPTCGGDNSALVAMLKEMHAQSEKSHAQFRQISKMDRVLAITFPIVLVVWAVAIWLMLHHAPHC